jgi:uncharacterized protein (TIRG00374 family)
MESNRKGSTVKHMLIGLIVSVVTIVVIFKLTETNVTWKVIFRADWKFLAVALLLHVLFWVFWGVRLKMLTSLLKADIPLSYALEVSIASTFLAAITPSSAGGEPLRIKMLADRGVALGSATAVVLVERLLDAIFFVTSLAVFLTISGFATKFGVEIGAMFSACLIGFIAFIYFIVKDSSNIDRFSGWLYAKIKRMGEDRAKAIANRVKEELKMFRTAMVEMVKNPVDRILLVAFLTALIWFAEFLVPSAVLLSLNQNPAFLLSITAQLILVILSLIPLTPGSSGIAEAGMVYLYSKFVPQHVLGVLVALWRFVTYYTNLFVGLMVNVKLLKSRYLSR